MEKAQFTRFIRFPSRQHKTPMQRHRGESAGPQAAPGPGGAPGPAPGPGPGGMSRRASFHDLKDEYLRDPTEVPAWPKLKSSSGSSDEPASRRGWCFHPVPLLRKDRHTENGSTLFDRLGGDEVVISLVCVFYDALLARFVLVLPRLAAAY